MKDAFIIFVYPKDYKPAYKAVDEPMGEVFLSYQAMLNRVVELTKIGGKFSVHKVGECVGDYS